MKVKLEGERRKVVLDQLKKKLSVDFDIALSDFRAEALMDVLLETVCPVIYNQAVKDARLYLQRKLEDLDGEVYVDEVVL